MNVNTLSSNANNDIHFFAVHQIILNLKQVSAAAYSFLSDISARKWGWVHFDCTFFSCDSHCYLATSLWGDLAWQAKTEVHTCRYDLFKTWCISFNTIMHCITLAHFTIHHRICDASNSIIAVSFLSVVPFCVCLANSLCGFNPWLRSNGTIKLSLVVPNSFVWHVLVRVCPSVALLGSKGETTPPICVTFNLSQARQASLALIVRAWHRSTCLDVNREKEADIIWHEMTESWFR